MRYMQEAMEQGSRLEPACKEVELSLRTYRRWLKDGVVQADGRPDASHPAPHNKLTDEEKAQIVSVANDPLYASLPPSQIVPKLADQGVYIASESSFYRVLKAQDQVQHRGRAKAPEGKAPPQSYTATGPNQVWSWDITYCPAQTQGQYFYLYVIEDIFSRKLVGWEVHDQECGTKAAHLLQRTILAERCFAKPLVLHSDNGAPMKSLTFKSKMEELGITASHSRPRVSNDNPYSESVFKTMKYCPRWPTKGFDTIEACRAWVKDFVIWYNEMHCHSGIRFVTPLQRHQGKDKDILKKRHKVYQEARERTPSRWSGNTRNWGYIEKVNLNPERTKPDEQDAA